MKYVIHHLFTLALLTCFSCQTETPATLSSEWKRIGPGGGGATFIPTFSYQTADRFMVRCDMTGSYLTNNGGESYQQVNFPNGASTYAFDPSNDKTIYAGSSWLYKSIDGGATWEKIFPKQEWIVSESFLGDHGTYSYSLADSVSIPRGNVMNISVDPKDEASLSFSINNVFFYTRNEGKDWESYPVDFPVEYIYTGKEHDAGKVIIYTRNSRYLFDIATQKFESFPLPEKMIPAFSFTAGVTRGQQDLLVYALHRDTLRSLDEPMPTDVWVSRNGGSQWEKVDAALITNEHGAKPSYSRISCATEDAEKVYLVTDRHVESGSAGKRYWYGTLRSGDGGRAWEWVWKGGGGSGRYGVKDGHGVSNLTDAWTEEAFGGEYIRLIDVGVYPGNGDVAIVTDWYRTMKTTDGGKTWREIYSERQPDDTFISRGMDVTSAYGIHRDPFDPDHLAISYTDIGYHHSFNGGKSWKRSATGVPIAWQNTCYWIAFDPEVKNKVWSVWSSLHDFPRGKMTRNPRWKQYGKGGVCVSTDGGETWAPVSGDIGEVPVTSIVLDPSSPDDKRTVYVSTYGKGVFKSVDDGNTWQPANDGIGENRCAFEITLAPDGALYLVISPTPAHKDGRVGVDYFSGAVYKSTDGAASWKKLALGGDFFFPNGLAFDPDNPQRLYLACWSDIMLSDLVGGDVARANGGNQRIKTNGGVFVSEDGGNSWQQTFDESIYVYDVTVDPRRSGRLFVNTFNQAAFASEDYGKTWRKIEGYDFHWGHRVLIDDQTHDHVFITTFGSSVWHGRPRLSTPVIMKENQ